MTEAGVIGTENDAASRNLECCINRARHLSGVDVSGMRRHAADCRTGLFLGREAGMDHVEQGGRITGVESAGYGRMAYGSHGRRPARALTVGAVSSRPNRTLCMPNSCWR